MKQAAANKPTTLKTVVDKGLEKLVTTLLASRQLSNSTMKLGWRLAEIVTKLKAVGFKHGFTFNTLSSFIKIRRVINV